MGCAESVPLKVSTYLMRGASKCAPFRLGTRPAEQSRWGTHEREQVAADNILDWRKPACRNAFVSPVALRGNTTSRQ